MSKLLLVILLFFMAACTPDSHLRGEVESSNDGLTYFMVADDANGTCTSVLLDGKPWPYKTGEKGKVRSGTHEIDCNGAVIGFEIPEGMVFKFDYWGP